MLGGAAKENYGRYSGTLKESKHPDYHCDVKKPPPGKPSVVQLPREEQLAQLKAKLKQIQRLSDDMHSTEPFSFTIGKLRFVGIVF